MATRQQVNKQKTALKNSLLADYRAGRLVPGTPAPSLRQLAEDFQISKNVVTQTLQELVEEGIFYTVARVGTFVGQPRSAGSDAYLLLLPQEPGLSSKVDLKLIQQGFEERVGERGSISIAMPVTQAILAREAGLLPPIAGLFDMAYRSANQPHWGPQPGLPRVGFRGRVEDPAHSDWVSYDDIGGGRLATEHLLQHGHRTVAFLGLHTESPEVGELVWSQDRERGWLQALQAAGQDPRGLAFHPANLPDGSLEAEVCAGRELAAQILENPGVTAVVAANDHAASGLVEGFRATRLPATKWPAVVGFDNLPLASENLLTSLRLPAEQIGRTAADLLWERRHNQLQGGPVLRLVSMRLIARLTSRHNWSLGMQNAPQLPVGALT